MRTAADLVSASANARRKSARNVVLILLGLRMLPVIFDKCKQVAYIRL
jgi:hypothetical protein